MKLTSPNNPMDEWVVKAFTEDEMVVELLLRLKHGETVESENPDPLRWGFRKPRSRPSRLGVNIGIGFLKKEFDSDRASPMTPLCWSGGSGSGGSTSPSAATADCFEDTSHHQPSCSTSTGSDSKAINEFTSFCSRRSKKKKTFLELKDAEILHLKERFELEKKIANVQATYKERNVKNQSLKKIKLEYSDRVKTDQISESNHKESETKTFFFVPDLNMTPTEED